MEDSKYYTEMICQQVYQKLKDCVDEKWIRHQCQEVGCNARFVVLDGYEKLYRYCCAAPFERKVEEKGSVFTNT